MLRILNLTIENFGPYKDKKVVEFPEDGGVTIIYGENMRGKTILLNAIRYAFLGKVIYRGAREVSLHQLGNWENALDGIFGFTVNLEFEYQGQRYELIRQCKPKHGISTPESNDDYEQETILRRNGDVLGPDMREAELSKIMPEKIARFFLFDGELLQEYEQLLRDESEMGPQIKEAIERILGVPILTNSRADFAELHKRAQREESKAVKKDQRTVQIGKLLETLDEKRAHHEKEIQRLTTELEEYRNHKASLEETISKHQNVRILIEESDRLREDINAIEAKIEEQNEKAKELMAVSWLGLLKSKVRRIQSEYEEKLGAYREEQAKLSVIAEMKELISSGISEKKCPICLQKLESDALEHLEGELYKLERDNDGKLGTQDIESVLQVLATLRNFTFEDKSDLLKEILKNIDGQYVEKSSKLDRIKEIRDITRGHDRSKVRTAVSLYEKAIAGINILEDGIFQEREKVQITSDQIRDLEKRLDSMEIAGLEKERKKRELCVELLRLFEDGVDVYRERLRAKVQEDSTKIFLTLTTEPDYSGLRINDNYGLVILHKDGEEIPIRSAGAEHIVALSLMGALQRNAPLRGPIVMDSPFGRLDEEHTTKVIRSLPSMANQVVLLVYESELRPEIARKELLGKLKAEYKLVRQSARHTTIDKLEN